LRQSLTYKASNKNLLEITCLYAFRVSYNAQVLYQLQLKVTPSCRLDNREMTIEESLRILVIETTSQYLLSPSSKGKNPGC
jgi:hypothetical protein